MPDAPRRSDVGDLDDGPGWRPDVCSVDEKSGGKGSTIPEKTWVQKLDDILEDNKKQGARRVEDIAKMRNATQKREHAGLLCAKRLKGLSGPVLKGLFKEADGEQVRHDLITWRHKT